MDKELLSKRFTELESALTTFRRTGFAIKGTGKLRGSDKFFLMAIASIKQGKPVNPSEIAESHHVTLAAVTHHIKLLESNGLITKSVSMDDRRSSLISLSTVGRSMVNKIKKHHTEKLTNLIEYLGEEDIEKLIYLLGRISNYLKEQRSKKEVHA
jgi:DNA-binding MarR family transcriptional regulator